MLWNAEYTFIGVTHMSTARNIFRAHYTLKEIKPLSINRTTLAAEAYTGPLPVWEVVSYRGRLEPCPNRPAIHKTLTFRHYVSVVVPNHGFSLRTMLLSNHPLALERGRWAERHHPFIPRNQCLCCLCKEEVESPEHALFECTRSWELLNTIAECLNMAYRIALSLRRARTSTSVDLLHLCLMNRAATQITSGTLLQRHTNL